MKFLAMVLVTAATVVSMADVPPKPHKPPHVEPGPIQKIAEDAVSAMDAMSSAKAADMKKFMAAGNRITAATFQALQPGMSIYTFTRQKCTSGGVVGPQCLGGAQLQVSLTEKRSGEMTEVTVTSSVVMLR